MLFFDYVTLLSAYYHAYDPWLVWQFIQKERSGTPPEPEPEKRIVDWLNKITEHLYIDDMTAVVGVVNPAANARKLEVLSQRGNLSKSVSHEARIYAFWDFAYACSAMTFSSMSNLLWFLYAKASTVFEKKGRMWLSRMNKERYLMRTRCQIEHVFNSCLYGTKADAIPVNNAIFKAVGSIQNAEGATQIAENQMRSQRIEHAWNSSLLSLFFTVTSFLISVAAFGMVSRVFIDGYYSTCCCLIGTEPPREAIPLLEDILRTQKVWLIAGITVGVALLFALIACVIGWRLRRKRLPIVCGYKNRSKPY